MFLRTMPRHAGRQTARRYTGLRQTSGARPTSAAVSFLEAAAETMKDVREALERVFGPRLTREEIERRQDERQQEAEARERHRAVLEEIEYRAWLEEQRRRAELAETRGGAGGSAFMSGPLDHMLLWQHDQTASGGNYMAAMPAVSDHFSPHQ